MTNEEITQMARESQLFDFRDDFSSVPADYAGSICLFAQLVAAKEREACAMLATDEDCIVEGGGYYDQLGDARATAENIADCIRARGNK